MDKIWLKSYPAGVPQEIDAQAFPNLVALFDHSVASYATRPAFSSFKTVLTYAEIDAQSRAFAAFLQNELGLSKGERIAIMMPNLLQYPIALFGALRAGLVVVNVNPLYTPRELQFQLSDSGAKAIVILENFAHVLAKCVSETTLEHVIVTHMGDMLAFPKSVLTNVVVKHVKKLVPSYRLEGSHWFRDALKRGGHAELKPVALVASDLAFLQYTGGTTGLAKGAMLTHGNMVANVEQAAAWLAPMLTAGEEVIVTALPLYHIFALTANCLVFVRYGSENLLITNPRDLPAFVNALKGVAFTAITGVNTLFNALLNTPGFSGLDFSHLKISLGGGMAVQRAVAERWKETTGTTLVEAYGLTETSPAVCINPLDLEEFNASIGLPVSSTECSIRDDSGAELGPGEVGELWVRGPQVMVGYWQRPEETAQALMPEGWFRTGDVARIDEAGFVYIVDRMKDVIVVSGFNVYPNEIEDVISGHSGVLEVGAIGVEDEHSGEAVMVVVVKKVPDLTADELRQHCRERLTGYKRPKHIEFADELPKTNVGKILRRELRARLSRSPDTERL